MNGLTKEARQLLWALVALALVALAVDRLPTRVGGLLALAVVLGMLTRGRYAGALLDKINRAGRAAAAGA